MGMNTIRLNKRKIVKSGGQQAFSIPKSFIDNGLIDPGKRYDVVLTESKEEEKEESEEVESE